jgi:hypothetical protein
VSQRGHTFGVKERRNVYSNIGSDYQDMIEPALTRAVDFALDKVLQGLIQ